MSRREVLWGEFYGHVPLQTLRDDRPLSAIQALMENREHEYVDGEDRLRLREAVAEAFVALPPRDQYILNARIFEQKSVRALAEILGVSHVHVIRLTRQAKERLETALQQNDLVRERMGMEPLTWDDSAARWVRYYERMLEGVEEPLHLLDIGGVRDDLWDAARGEWDSEMFGAIDHLALYALDRLIDPDAAPSEPAWGPAVALELADMLAGKQARYGCNNILRFGYLGIAIRMSDKVERILQAQRTGQTDDEDPFADIVGYAVIAHMVNDGTFTLPLRDEVNQGVES